MKYKNKMFALAISIFCLAVVGGNIEAAVLPKAEVTRCAPMTLTPEANDYLVFDGSSAVKGTGNYPVQVVMNFATTESSAEASLNGYYNWKCDFYLKFEGVKNNKFSTEGCYLAGSYGGLWVVVLPKAINAEELECGIEYPVVAAYDPNITYKQICETVKNFTAAIYVAPAVLAENPDFKVTLALKMTNPDNSAEVITIGKPATYTVSDLKPELSVTIPVKEKVTVGGLPATYEQQEKLSAITTDLIANAAVAEFKPGFDAPDNGDEVAAAKESLKSSGVDEAQVASASPMMKIAMKDVVLDEEAVPVRMTFDVSPVVEAGGKTQKIDSFSSELTFRLPVYTQEDKAFARIYHGEDIMGYYPVQVSGSDKFVEVKSKNFSLFTLEPVAAVAMIGKNKFATLADAVASSVENDTIRLTNDVVLAETVIVPADKKNLTLDLNGFVVSSGNADAISNLGELTVRDSSEEGFGGIDGVFANSGKAYLAGGAYTADIRNNEGGQIEATGGAFIDAEVCNWVAAGYVASRFDATAEEGEEPFSYYVVAKLPTATVTPVPDAELNGELTFALKFKADSISDLQYDVFGDWYADFVLTVNKDVVFNANGGDGVCGYLSGQYDEWSPNWVNVPFENVTVKAGESLKIMEYAASLMNKTGLKLRYWEVYDLVREFDCGVFFKPEFLAANEDLEVKLSLRMFNPEDETESYAVGIEYVFMPPKTTDEMTVRDRNGVIVNCATVKDAVDTVIAKGDAVNGGEVTVLKDLTIAEDIAVKGTRNLFFDLGKNKLTLAEGKKFSVTGVNVAFIGSGSLEGFTAENIELDDKSVLTLPASAQALAESFEQKGKYVTRNEDNTWSVAEKFELQIQMNGTEPAVGFLKDTRRDYVIEASADLSDWTEVEYVSTDGEAEVAVPLKWQKPQDGTFFRVRAVVKSAE